MEGIFLKKSILFLSLMTIVSMALVAQAGGTAEQRLIGTWTNVVAGSKGEQGTVQADARNSRFPANVCEAPPS